MFASPKDFANKEDSFDNKVEYLRNLDKEEKDAILRLELNKLGNYSYQHNIFQLYFKMNWTIILLELKF